MTIIYSTATCVYCKMVEALFKQFNHPYRKVMMDEDQEAQQEVFKATGVLTAPITYINGKYIVGYSPAKLMKEVKGE